MEFEYRRISIQRVVIPIIECYYLLIQNQFNFQMFWGIEFFFIELLPEEFTSLGSIDVLICCMAYCRKDFKYHFLLSTQFLILAALLSRVKAW